MKPLIEIRTGSHSDIPKIKEVYEVLDSKNIPYSPRVLSAHRTPQVMAKQAQDLLKNGFKVSIAAAGGAAHLPGMSASETLAPVIGIPVSTSSLEGVDSLYSILQMPPGIPVGCVGVGNAHAAGVVAAQIVELGKKDAAVEVVGSSKQLHAMLKELGVGVSSKNASAAIVLYDLDAQKPAIKETSIPTIIVPYSSKKVDVKQLIELGKQNVVLMSINRFVNAALFAAQIIGLSHAAVQGNVVKYRQKIARQSLEKDTVLQKEGVSAFL